MQTFDVSKHVHPTRTNPSAGLDELIQWLNDNVGLRDNSTGIFAMHGQGWAITKLFNGRQTSDGEGYSVVTWHANIEDDQKATMFALKWIK